MTTAPLLHPTSVAAHLKAAEAHEQAAAVLVPRQPAAAERHAQIALLLRARARAGR